MLVATKTYALEPMILRATHSNPRSPLSHYHSGLAGKVPIASHSPVQSLTKPFKEASSLAISIRI